MDFYIRTRQHWYFEPVDVLSAGSAEYWQGVCSAAVWRHQSPPLQFTTHDITSTLQNLANTTPKNMLHAQDNKRYVGLSRLDNIYLCFMICAQLWFFLVLLRDHWKHIEEGIFFYRKKSPSTADYFLGLRRLHLQWPPPLSEKIGRNEENYKNWLWLNPITTLYSLRQLPTACKGVLNCPRDTFKK